MFIPLVLSKPKEKTMEDKKVFDAINAGNSLTFPIPYDVTVKGMQYTGTATYRYPNVKDTIKIGIEESRLRGTLVEYNGKVELVTVASDSLDDFTAFLIEGLATLKVLAVNVKELDVDNLPTEVVIDIHRRYLRPEGPTDTNINDEHTEDSETI